MSDLSQYLNRIVRGNCIEQMKKLPDESVDAVFADPPYNLQLGGALSRPDASHVDAVTDEWDKFASIHDYDDFTYEWMREAKRVLKPHGTLWVIGSYHNIYRVGNILQNLNFWILNDIVWVKNNPMPNFKGTRFTNAHETLLWCSKDSKAKYTFNYDSMKAFNDDTQMRSDWNLPICSGGERLKDENGNKAHSTQKPESLLYRVIASSTNIGDVILDPFSGSGTTAAVAKKLGRQFIGFEMEEKYIKVANKRLDGISPVEDLSLFEPIRKEKVARIPFGSVLEHGLLKPGDYLFDHKRNFDARIMADGTLKATQNIRGSIHQVGAKLQNTPSCNGWTFWHFEQKKSLHLIDELRQEIREESKQ